MNKKPLLLTLIFLLLITSNGLYAAGKIYDFNKNGLFYRIINQEKHEVYVVSEKPRGGYTTKPEGELTIPETVTDSDVEYTVKGIAKQAFYMCEKITSITLPNSLVSIGDKAFLGCHGLKIVSLSKNISKLGRMVFTSCANLEAINVDNDNASYSSIDGVLYNKDASTLILCPAGKSGEFVIPNSVHNINARAFYGCTKRLLLISASPTPLPVSDIVAIFASKKGRISQCKSHLSVVNEVTAFGMYVLSIIL